MQDNHLKYDLLDKLISIEDINLLEKVNNLIGDVDINKSTFKTTPLQKKMLEKSQEDMVHRNFITDEELNEDEEKWLNG
ncbi:MAG: hypothetical protein M3Z26_15960 [Bacteroidota bacterium]|nr:hypothetical protein [Bacteroidota bacterium]